MTTHYGYIGSKELLTAGAVGRLREVVITTEECARCFDGTHGSSDFLVPFSYPVMLPDTGWHVAGADEAERMAWELGWNNYHNDCPDADEYVVPHQHPKVLEGLRNQGFGLVVATTPMESTEIKIVIPLHEGMMKICYQAYLPESVTGWGEEELGPAAPAIEGDALELAREQAAAGDIRTATEKLVEAGYAVIPPKMSAKPNIQRLFDAVNDHYEKTRRLGAAGDFAPAKWARVRTETRAEMEKLGIADLFDWSEEQ